MSPGSAGRRREMLPGQEDRALAEAAAQLGMSYTPSPMETLARSRGSSILARGSAMRDRMAAGQMDGVGVRILETASRTRILHYYGVTFHGVDLGLKIRRQAWWHRPLQVMRVAFATEDPSFEDLVWLRSSHPARTAEFLTRERRDAIVEAISAVRNLSIRDDHLDGFEARSRFRPATAADIVARIELLVRVAKTLSGPPS